MMPEADISLFFYILKDWLVIRLSIMFGNWPRHNDAERDHTLLSLPISH